MKIKYFEYIAIYLSVFLACLYIGFRGRGYFIEKGADEFTVNIIFWGSIVFGILIFAILILFLEPIVNWILKHFSKNTKSELVEDKKVYETNMQVDNSAENLEISVEDTIDTNVVRKAQLQKKVNQDHEKLQIALNYTKRQFALYISEEDLDLLCNAIISYSKQEEFSKSKLIETTGLSNLDLYHFGWNIWNHFRVTNQDSIAKFLKSNFVSLKDIEQETIKAHLRDDEQKGIIKIQNQLLD